MILKHLVKILFRFGKSYQNFDKIMKILLRLVQFISFKNAQTTKREYLEVGVQDYNTIVIIRAVYKIWPSYIGIFPWVYLHKQFLIGSIETI